MEDIKTLDWSWKAALSSAEQFNSFEKTFTENDIFYCHLNNLDPNLIPDLYENINDKYKLIADKNNIIDPRNNNIIYINKVDHTTQGDYYRQTCIYNQFTKKSTLTKDEHRICLRVLQFLKKNKTVPASDKRIFDDTFEKRKAENKLFMDFVIERISSQSINSAEKILNDTYKLYLIKEAESILTQSNLKFTLQTALPLPWCFQIQQNQAVLNKCHIIKQKGYIPQYKFIDFKKLKKTELNNLFCENNEENDFNQICEYDIIIPEETFIILLGAFDDINNCGWEFLLDIETTQEEKKVLRFYNPFPLRFINYVTNAFVFEQKLKQYVITSNEFNWLEINSNGQLIDLDTEIPEINAVNLNMDYKMQKIDEIRDNKQNIKLQQDIKTNSIMINCQLNNIINGNSLNLLIVNSNLDFCDDKKIPSYINLSTKLQYKKEFGTEVMTKNELIKEWTRQALIPNSVTKRCHIDVTSFDTILKEKITLIDIENDLSKLYNINMLNVVASLDEFFKMVISFPCSKYLLKYDPNKTSKLMIYKEENEKLMETTTTLSTHELYRNVLEKCNSIQNKNILPISNTVVTSLHERYNIIPCCFPFWCGSEIGITNDRNLIIEKHRNIKKNLAAKIKKKKLKKKRKLNK